MGMLSKLLFAYSASADRYSFLGIFWKAARMGERLSPYISICCIFMAVSPLLMLDGVLS